MAGTDLDHTPTGSSPARESMPAPQLIIQRPSLRPESLHRLGRALQAATVVSALVFLAQADIALWAAAVFGQSYDEAAASTFNAQGVMLGLADLLMVVVTMVLWMVWQYRFAAAMPEGALRHSPGWHVGSWFVPILNLYYPLQNLADLRRAVGSGRTQPSVESAGRTRARVPKLYGIWWGVYLAGEVLDSVRRIVARFGPDPETLTELAARLVFSGFVEIVQAGSRFLAIAVVADLTRRGVAWLRGRNDAAHYADRELA